GFPGNRIQFLWQILPIEDVQVEGWYDPGDAQVAQNVPGGDFVQAGQVAGFDPAAARFHSFPAFFWGQYFEKSYSLNNTPPGSLSIVDFAIKRELGIVEFAEGMYFYDQNNPNGPVQAAQIALRCAVSVKDPVTAAPDRFIYEVPTGAANGT